MTCTIVKNRADKSMAGITSASIYDCHGRKIGTLRFINATSSACDLESIFSRAHVTEGDDDDDDVLFKKDDDILLLEYVSSFRSVDPAGRRWDESNEKE
jgi:hypothetical protein